jgi:NADH-quinone oxidoreductase subunit L
MTTPLILLATGSAVIGFINIPSKTPILPAVFGEHVFATWLEESVIHAHGGTFNWGLALLATALAVGAIYFARMIYTDQATSSVMDGDPLEKDPQTASVFTWSNARLYWDETYFRFIVVPYQRAAYLLGQVIDWQMWHDFFHERIIYRGFTGIAALVSTPIDRYVIDDGFLALARGTRRLGERLRLTQTGYVRTYAFSVLVGAVLVIVAILFPVFRDWLGL